MGDSGRPLDDGEKPLQAAKRELREETGFSAKKWVKLVPIGRALVMWPRR